MRLHVNLPGPFSVSTRIPGTGRRRYYTTKQRSGALKALTDIGRAERQRKAAAQQQAARDARLQAWHQEWQAREWQDELRRQAEARAYQQWAWNQEQQRLNQQRIRMNAARAARATTPHRRGNHTHQTIGGVTWKTPSPNNAAPSAGTLFTPRSPKQTLCSPQCSDLRYNRKRRRKAAEQARQWRKENPERAHATARAYRQSHRAQEAARVARWRKSRQGYASHKLSQYKQQVKRLKTPPKDFDSQTLILKAYHVDALELWKNSDQTCIVCGDLIDEGINHPDPMSRTIEHIIPIARGGKHEESNIAFSHLGCNLRKGRRLLDELDG